MAIETETAGTTGTGEGNAAASQPVKAATFDRSALEAKTAERLAALSATDDSAESSTDDVETGEEVNSTDTNENPADGDGEQTQDDEQNGESEAAETAAAGTQPVVKKPATPTLPDAYRRSLKAYDWSDEEIDANFEALGPKFIETAQRIHANRNAEVAKWADAGRAARQQEQQQAPAQQQPQQLQALQPVDAKKLKEHYGEDALIDSIVNPVNAAIQQINALMPVIQQSQTRSQQAELETLGRQIEGFFGGKELEAYKEFYGDPSKTLTEVQTQARNKVLELADALIAGAKLQGRKLSLNDALTMAHDSASGEYKAQAARTTLKKNLTQRQKGMQLRPTGKKPATAAKPGDRSSLEKKVAGKLAAVFA